MKKIFFTIVIILVVLLGGAYLLSENGAGPTGFEGPILSIDARNATSTLSVQTQTGVRTVFVTNTTNIQTGTTTVDRLDIHEGYVVRGEGDQQRPGEIVADSIEILEMPDLFLGQPRPNDTVGTPFYIEGHARGPWYFEATFSVAVEDEDGNVLFETYAEALDEWMTTDYVPFARVIDIDSDYTGPATLVLQNANPSGLPENQKERRIPVNIGGQENMIVDVYFGREMTGTDVVECDAVTARPRVVERTSGTARAAIEALLAGPTYFEQKAGYFTSINDGVEIQDISIRDGTLSIDFNERLDESVGGSCRIQAIHAQIEETALQFDTVDDVAISIDGRTEDILQP